MLAEVVGAMRMTQQSVVSRVSEYEARFFVGLADKWHHRSCRWCCRKAEALVADYLQIRSDLKPVIEYPNRYPDFGEGA